ncbi:uncharacterized protein LOC134817075 [Bolinopsis microptera]|uniref:uncharacterized protein LOC134817075 n=1 Tax=Bolinopsis microptera TaxID=2820187 RepID=UPI00307ACDEA
MNLRLLSRSLLKGAPILLTKIQPNLPTLALIHNPQTICTRHFSSVDSQVISSSDEHFKSESTVQLQEIEIRKKWFMKNQASLFSDPQFFQTPVLMLHCSWTDFAVSFHAPDKLDELDCLWSCFPCDLKIYGFKQRTEAKTVQLLLVRARGAMKKYGVKKCRIAFKGYQSNTLIPALTYLESFPFEFISVTDLTRKIGEVSPVYQRPLPRYPHHKVPLMRAMKDGPEFAPKNLIDKFRRLNVKWVDLEQKGQGLSIKSDAAKASKRGYILKKSQSKEKKPPVRNLMAPLDPPS